MRWPVRPLSQRPGTLVNACTAPAPHAPHSPQPLPHRLPRLGHNPRRRPRSRQGLPRRAYPSSMGPSSPGLPHRLATRCSSEVSPREAGTGAEPLSTGGAAHCEAGSGQGHQGRARGHACEHPPPSMLTAPAGDNRPLRAAAQEHKRTRPANRVTALHAVHTPHYRHEAITSAQRIQVSTGPSLPARTGRTLHATTRSHRQPNT